MKITLHLIDNYIAITVGQQLIFTCPELTPVTVNDQSPVKESVCGVIYVMT